jgi:hypothetical protein
MFETELYQQSFSLATPWKMTDVRLDGAATEIHVQVSPALQNLIERIEEVLLFGQADFR